MQFSPYNSTNINTYYNNTTKSNFSKSSNNNNSKAIINQNRLWKFKIMTSNFFEEETIKTIQPLITINVLVTKKTSFFS